MRAVWSFWSRPFLAQKGWAWRTPLHHLLAWGLSVGAASRHYPDTLLVTDRYGKGLLVDTLGLSFANVSTELERLREADPDWWALGKLIAYGMQDRPFVHIDTDAFLWKPLPPEVVEAPVFAQCPEYFPRLQRRTLDIERSFRNSSTQLPMEWRWAVSRDDDFIREENCGIIGGNRVDFLRYYAETAADLALRPEHARAWSGCAKSNTVIEQFFLAACVDFYRFHPDSPYRGVRTRYLFPSWDDASNPTNATRAGFTHLLGDAKSHPLVGRRMEARVRREDHAYFRRCENVAARI
ncbi:MAG TPA: DUF6734 family protein [Bryobacteraceae bacterium]|nr:DUF6734 family protein [Bryobacteraceae bacterium]